MARTAGERGQQAEAMEWYRKAAENGDFFAIHTVAQAHDYNNEPGEAADWYRRGAELGNPISQVTYAGRLLEGRGVPRNEKGELVYRPDDVLWTAGDLPRPRPFPTPTWETLEQLRDLVPRDADQQEARHPAARGRQGPPRTYDDRGAYEYQPGVNPPPVARLTVTPSAGRAPLAVVADGSASTAAGGTIVSYRFDFGDGTIVGPQSPAIASHTYAAGTWSCRLTVTDDRGASASTVVEVAAAAAQAGADEIHWTFTGPTSVTFDWRGADPTIRYGLTTGYGLSVTAVAPSPMPFSSSGPFWEARLTGLRPGTVYHYSIGKAPDHCFRTMPAAGENFVVYVEGDIGDTSNYSRVGAVQSLIARGAPAFVLGVGDLTYGNANGQAAVDNHFNNVMDWALEAAYMPAWGNHEWDSSGDDLRNYKGRFDLPNPQTSPGAPIAGCCGEDWYWFDCGGVRFIAYPEPFTSATWPDWATRVRALMDAAQADPTIRFIVTFGHRPALSSGWHPGDPGLLASLLGLGASHSKYVLTLNGHSHNYERSVPQSGITLVTAGIGGSSLEQANGPCPWPGGCPAPPWCAFRALHHGALRLRFGQASILGDAICGPPGSPGGSNANDIIERILNSATRVPTGQNIPVSGTACVGHAAEENAVRLWPWRGARSTKAVHEQAYCINMSRRR